MPGVAGSFLGEVGVLYLIAFHNVKLEATVMEIVDISASVILPNSLSDYDFGTGLFSTTEQ